MPILYNMCVNLPTSIISFLIGTISGVYLVLNEKVSVEKKVIGFFIICISLVQLIEACLYYFDESYYNILIRLLSICLGLQGFVIYFASKLMLNVPISNVLYYTIILISISITFLSLNAKFVIDKKTKCLNWTFLDKNKYIGDLLYIMYALIFYLLIKIEKFRIYGYMLAITYFISYMLKPLKNSPSAWCISSALISPLVILLPQ